MDIPGLLAGIDRTKQAVKSKFGLLMDNPQEYFRLINESARDINRQDRLAVQGDRAQMAGRQPTAEQLAAMAASRQRAEDLAMGFVGSIKVTGQPSGMKVFRAGAEEGMTAKSGGPTFYSLEQKGTEPFQQYGPSKEYSISPQNVIDASRGDGIKLYREFLKETGSPAGYGSSGRPFWTAEHDFRNWLRKNGVQFDAIMFDEPTGIPSIAVYKQMERNGQPAGLLEAPKTQYELAHEVAQKNAVEMLGLPPNNTAMDRARALGFFGDWYHGSPNPNIKAFDPKLAGQRGVDFGEATWATKNPDNASGYSLNWAEYADHPAKKAIEEKIQSVWKRFGEARAAGKNEEAAAIRNELKTLPDGDELYESFLNYQLPSSGSTVYPLMIRGDGMPWVDGGKKNFSQVNAQAIDTARREGAAGVRINDVADNSGRFNGLSDVKAVFDPSRIRSKFAAFDPKRINEPDLLAAGVPLGLIAGSDIELPKPKERKKKK